MTNLKPSAFILFILLHACLYCSSQQKLSAADIRMLDSIESLQKLPARGTFTPRPGFSSNSMGPSAAKPDLHGQYQAAEKQSNICYDTSGRFYLKRDDHIFYVQGVKRSRDGNLLLCGETVNRTPPYKWRGYLMKCDDYGNVQWAKTYDSVGSVVYSYVGYYNLVELNDGSIVMAGSTTNMVTGNYDIIVTRTDNTGNLTWSQVFRGRFWGPGSGSADWFYLQQISEDPADGSIYFIGGNWALGHTLTKLDPLNGNIHWSRHYTSYSLSFDRPFGFDIRSNEIVTFAKASGWVMPVIKMARINKATGDTIATRMLTITDTAGSKVGFLIPDQLQKLNNGNYALTGRCYGNWIYLYDGSVPLYQAAVVEIDQNLNFVRGYSFRNSIESNSYNSHVTIFPDGTGMFTMLRYISSYTADVYFVQFVNDKLRKQRMRHYTQGIPIETPTIRMQNGGDLHVRLVGDTADNIHKIEFLKLHITDTSSVCVGQNDISTFTQPFTLGPTNSWLDSVGINAFVYSTNKTLTTGDMTYEFLPGCEVSSYCDSLKLATSEDTVCAGAPIVLKVIRNRACGAAPIFNLPPQVQSFTQLTDSTYRLIFTAPWQGYLSGSITTCETLRDSVKLTVMISPGPVNLGADKELCANNTLLLNARKGYTSYRWQDNSTDSVFLVTAPGTYHVEVKDACGNAFRDTVIIAPAPPIPFNIGPDRTKCNNDTLRLTAPAGFMNYTWSNNYNISSLTGQQVIVNPLMDTAYYVKAEKTPGCFAFDTLRVIVHHSPAIVLGNDTSFCQGQSMVLNAGSGFATYAWSTSAITQTIQVGSAGTYSVIGTTLQGCRSFDTLKVINMYANPVVNLDENRELCDNSIRELDAGNFTSYLWHDGSTGRKYAVAATGKYYVRVWDNNGCTATDTTTISTILPLPAAFLPSDTVLCTYGSLDILPLQGFQRYVWSTNSTSSSITIKSAGLYWLQATDDKGCTGTDSIRVQPKECLYGLFVPNAFTPNSDRVNDGFKAMLHGPVLSFEIIVYNRWGQVVFRSTDRFKSWDGTYQGKLQDSNVFLWVCKYHLDGSPPKVEKGSVLLLR